MSDATAIDKLPNLPRLRLGHQLDIARQLHGLRRLGIEKRQVQHAA